MKLTRRGKRVRALFILAGIGLAIGAVTFRATHHPVYVCPSSWEWEKVCTLKGYEKN